MNRKTPELAASYWMGRFSIFRNRYWPISTRLTFWYGLTLFTFLAGFAVYSYLVFSLSAHHDFDRHLEHETRELLPFLTFIDETPALQGLDALRSVALETEGAHGTYVRLLTTAGSVIYRSPNFDNHEFLPVALPPDVSISTVSRSWEAESIRSRYTPLRAENDTLRGWVEVSAFEWTLHEETRRLAWILTVGVFFGTLLSIAGGLLLARRGLAPVARITDTVKSIGATNLQNRLSTDFGARDELTDLAETFNDLISRLEESFSRERRFSSNAAHQLFTPLATIRNEIEIALRHDRDRSTYQETLSTLLTDVNRMSAIVDGLLRLSRAERMADGRGIRRANLSNVVETCVDRQRNRADKQGIRLTLNAQPAVYAAGDPLHLEEVVDNLLDNALKYTPEGGDVHVLCYALHKRVRVEIADTGVGFDRKTSARLFDGFFRAEVPEVKSQPGSGLGLSIAQAIVHAYGGRITATSEEPGKGSTFTVDLPAPADE